MKDTIRHKNPTVRDVAREAGVSLATVDRVLNDRQGVRTATREKVEKAVVTLNYTRDVGASLLARAKILRIRFLLPDEANPFMQNVAKAIKQQSAGLSGNRTQIEVTRVPALDPEELVNALNTLGPKQCDCAIIVASDQDSVRKAVDKAVLRGVNILTLVSDLPGSRRQHFIGIDNVAAGRTAGSLMGRFCPPGARIGLIVGSMGLRDHRDRFIGFHDLVLEEFPGLELVGPVEGFDDTYETGKRAHELLVEYPDIAGIYSMGAGNAGLISAMNSLGRTHKTRVIVHELTDETIDGLNEGILDVVLDQNPQAEVRAAIEAAQKMALATKIGPENKAIEISIFLRDNLGVQNHKQD